MASAMDVANFFIDVFKGTDDPMTMLRVMKIAYNAQGCSLARTGEPLFEEEIEAWKHGPVVPSIYRSLGRHKDGKIKRPLGKYSKDVFTRGQIDLMIDVAVKYGKYTTGTLVNMCHAPESPWSKVYVQNRRNIKIPKELIREHFSVNEPLDVFDAEQAIKNMKLLGYRDPEGNTVLPNDFDD
ncbi:MAG: DUF4065 domain-containing protein [Methanomassiliicoccaceae archaeon]|nr:DUF4065 domain-containing protein [Methanomassiliicoccaceae archaeon]